MATEYGGYMGKILLIDLTTETTEEYPFTDQQRRETLGGKALACSQPMAAVHPS